MEVCHRDGQCNGEAKNLTQQASCASSPTTPVAATATAEEEAELARSCAVAAQGHFIVFITHYTIQTDRRSNRTRRNRTRGSTGHALGWHSNSVRISSTREQTQQGREAIIWARERSSVPAGLLARPARSNGIAPSRNMNRSKRYPIYSSAASCCYSEFLNRYDKFASDDKLLVKLECLLGILFLVLIFVVNLVIS